MNPQHVAILRNLESCDGGWLSPYVIADAVRAATDELTIARTRIATLERELAAAQTYIRELEAENAGSFW